MITCAYVLHQLNPLLGTKLDFISTSSRLFLVEAFRNDYVTAFSTTLRSATEKNELGGNETVPCPSKMTQRSSTATWLGF